MHVRVVHVPSVTPRFGCLAHAETATKRMRHLHLAQRTHAAPPVTCPILPVQRNDNKSASDGTLHAAPGFSHRMLQPVEAFAEKMLEPRPKPRLNLTVFLIVQ